MRCRGAAVPPGAKRREEPCLTLVVVWTRAEALPLSETALAGSRLLSRTVAVVTLGMLTHHMPYYFRYATDYILILLPSFVLLPNRLLKGSTFWITALAAAPSSAVFSFLLFCAKEKSKIPGESHLPGLTVLGRASRQRSVLNTAVTGCPRAPAVPCGFKV